MGFNSGFKGLNFHCYRESLITSGTAIHCFTCYNICEISLLPRVRPLTKSRNFKERLEDLERNLQIFVSDQHILTFESLVVTVRVCTPSPKIQNFYILPAEHLYLCTCLRKNIDFSLYNPQGTAFITEEASVYSEVRPGPLNKMDYVSSLNG